MISIDEERALSLAQAHWDYVRSTLEQHKISQNEILISQHHYLSAFIHGYKHGFVDANSSRGTYV